MSGELRGDPTSIFREEALAALRLPRPPAAPLAVGRLPGALVALVVVALTAALVVAAAIISSPQTVKGRAVIQFDGVRYVRTPSPGAIDEVLVEPGQRVAAGEVIARMDATPRRRAHAHARREYEDAARAMLRDPGSESARVMVGQRAQALRRARAELEATEIRAPVGGHVQAVRMRPGQRAADAQVVGTIAARPGAAGVLALVPGNARPTLEVGAPLRVILDQHPRAPISLEVQSIAGELLRPEDVDALGVSHVGAGDGVSVALRAPIPAHVVAADGRSLRLFDGMTAAVEIVVRERSLLERLVGGWLR